MLRRILILCLALLVVGCHQPTHPVVRDLPSPVMPTPPTQSTEPSPKPPPLSAIRPPRSLQGLKVVIDAGHGGKDPGARGKSALPEKTIVLSIANEVTRLLVQRGATVICTRTTDRFLELEDRAAIAERHHADIFVAIHADSARRAGASGATVYISRGASGESLQAARRIASALNSAGIEFRGISRANYRVLVAHSRPAVLVECGFLTNSSDAARLNSPAHRAHIANAIANGIANYLAQ